VSPPGEPRSRARRVSPWSNRLEFGSQPSQTRAPNLASVSAEGGGTVTPTLGGGIGFSRELEAAVAAVAA
jgi:hypothetical protein